MGQSALLSARCRSDDHALLRHCTDARAWSPSATGTSTHGTGPTILALHGLNGSSESHYMKGIAAKAFARGMNVVRLNQRNCGNTEHLSAGLFHSGLTDDARHVIEELVSCRRAPSIAVAGYSLGGNLALKLAGEYGEVRPTRSSASQRSRRSSRSASARGRSSGVRTSSTNGISCASSRAGWCARNAIGQGCSIYQGSRRSDRTGIR